MHSMQNAWLQFGKIPKRLFLGWLFSYTLSMQIPHITLLLFSELPWALEAAAPPSVVASLAVSLTQTRCNQCTRLKPALIHIKMPALGCLHNKPVQSWQMSEQLQVSASSSLEKHWDESPWLQRKPVKKKIYIYKYILNQWNPLPIVCCSWLLSARRPTPFSEFELLAPDLPHSCLDMAPACRRAGSEPLLLTGG